MRKAEFEVPQEAMTEFADELVSRNLNNTVTGTTEDGEIIIEVEYDKDESDEVDELESILEKILVEQEEENEE
ncbi:MAG: hypothetical protein HY840_02580, partial [Bacteroidetes bacterium]|nr:hypothetical protein [Bacteroidota bacterium]